MEKSSLYSPSLVLTRRAILTLLTVGTLVGGAACGQEAPDAPAKMADTVGGVAAPMQPKFPLRDAPYHAAYRGAVGSKSGGPPGNVAFAQWLNRPVVWAEEFEPTGNWDDITGKDWLLRPWSKWKKEGEGRRLILSVPLLVGPKDRSGPRSGMGAGEPVSLEAGARGDYNAPFKKLAENLVKWDMADSMLRLGWEFNGPWNTAYAGQNPAAFAAYWRQVVQTMRSVPGTEQLQFCWNPTSGSGKFRIEDAYPGDEWVDAIGLDVYDQSWIPDSYPLPAQANAADIEARRRRAWEHILNEPYGLIYWRDFARQHNKPLAFPEWGVDNRPDNQSGGDNVLFVEEMHKFISDPDNNVYFHSYFDVEARDGHHQLSAGTDQHTTEFPLAAARFKELFGVATN